jgi:hypothetical protein
LEHQASRISEVDGEEEEKSDEKRGEREGTPGPEKAVKAEESPKSDVTEKSEAKKEEAVEPKKEEEVKA